MRPSTHVGNVSEFYACAAFAAVGYLVSKPLGDGYPYDMIADNGERLLRVQVKTGRLKNGVIICPMRSNNGRFYRKSQPKGVHFYHGKADLFAIYCPEMGKVYVFEPHQWSATPLLRVHPPLNNQTKGIRLASDYELQPLANPPLLGACEDEDELDELQAQPEASLR